MSDKYTGKYVKDRRIQTYPTPNALKIIYVYSYDQDRSLSAITKDLINTAIAQLSEKEQVRLFRRYDMIKEQEAQDAKARKKSPKLHIKEG